MHAMHAARLSSNLSRRCLRSVVARKNKEAVFPTDARAKAEGRTSHLLHCCHYSATPAASMPRRNTVKLKRPSKQLLRRRRNRLKRRRDKTSARRHQPKPSTLARKNDAQLALSIGEERVQLAVQTQDPAYIAAAQQLYENIEAIPMETLLEGSAARGQFAQLGGGGPVAIGKDELLDMDPDAEALRITDPETYYQMSSISSENNREEDEELERILSNLSLFDGVEQENVEEDVELIDDGNVNTSAFLESRSPAFDNGGTKELNARSRTARPMKGFAPEVDGPPAPRPSHQDRTVENKLLANPEKRLLEYEERMLEVASMTEKSIGILPDTDRQNAQESGSSSLRDYNFVLRVCAAHGRVDLAFQIFDHLIDATNLNRASSDNDPHPRPPNEATFVALGATCAKAGDADKCWEVIKRWREYFGVGEPVELSTSYITALSKAGNLKRAEEVFDDVIFAARDPLTNMVRRNNDGNGGLYTVDATVCNAMLSSFFWNGEYELAWELFHRMRQDFCDADSFTYTCMINVCAMEARPEQALVLIEEMEQRGFVATKAALNGIVKACARSEPSPSNSIRGDLRTALDIVGMTQSAFDDIEKKGFTPDLQSYRSLLLASSRMGRVGGALRAITDMSIVGGYEPDKVAITLLLSSYANAVTIGKSEYKRRKLQRELHEHREKTHALYGERVKKWVEEANMSPLGGAYHVSADTGMSEVGWLVGTANVDSEQTILEREAERKLALAEKFKGVGPDVAPILMALEAGTVQSEMRQGALQRGVGEGAGMLDMIEEGGGVRASTELIEHESTPQGILLEDDENTSSTAAESAIVEAGGNLERSYDDDIYDDDFGLASLIQKCYNDMGILDGESHPNQEALVEGATATMQWYVDERGLAVDSRLLNAYLSVFARCLRIQRALKVYRSFEPVFGIQPDSDSAIIILEMFSRANQLDRALAFFRVCTGEWTHDEAVTETQKWKIRKRTKKGWKRVNAAQIVPDEGYGSCVLDASTVDVDHQQLVSLERMYGVLLRGCAKTHRFETADMLLSEMYSRGLEPQLKDTFALRRKILMEATRKKGGDGDLSQAEAKVLEMLPREAGIRDRVASQLLLQRSSADNHY